MHPAESQLDRPALSCHSFWSRRKVGDEGGNGVKSCPDPDPPLCTCNTAKHSPTRWLLPPSLLLAKKVMRKGTVAFQAQVRGHQARLRVLALRYLNACLLAQRVVRGFVKRSQVSWESELLLRYRPGGTAVAHGEMVAEPALALSLFSRRYRVASVQQREAGTPYFEIEVCVLSE